jgi:predicted Zn-ribbon and HTH transcriptional regulator
MLNKLICWLKGHKRGKNCGVLPDDPLLNYFQCPRCKATWTRKVKA